jgi:zinc/manganese transport system substrate-binding protein
VRDQERFSSRRPALAAALVAAPLLAAACGGGDGSAGAEGHPTIVVTTPVLGDVVSGLVGEDATVEVIMPAGADPHEFQPSARQAAGMREADLVVANGGGFEGGLDDAVDGAEADGATVFRAAEHVAPPAAGTPAEDGVDPHFFTDPARMAEAAEALAGVLATEVDGLDGPAFTEQAERYVADLRTLDGDVEDILAAVPPERRTLVTNHDVFGAFAERYGFEVVGTVIPSATTEAAGSAGALDELAAVVEAVGVPAVFADTSAPTDLAEALADEVGDIEVVELYSETLGEPGSGADTYAGMVRTNAERIAAALAP